jgi:hypothetical protein
VSVHGLRDGLRAKIDVTHAPDLNMGVPGTQRCAVRWTGVAAVAAMAAGVGLVSAHGEAGSIDNTYTGPDPNRITMPTLALRITQAIRECMHPLEGVVGDVVWCAVRCSSLAQSANLRWEGICQPRAMTSTRAKRSAGATGCAHVTCVLACDLIEPPSITPLSLS